MAVSSLLPCATALPAARRRRHVRQLAGLLVLASVWTCTALTSRGAAAQDRYFGIHVVDEDTGRGVPLVELETVHHLRYVTDSAGWIALDEPELMDRRVFFQVRSHGYSHAQDGFGFAGVVLNPTRGQEAVIRVRRVNVAQRLYRLTGEGIYRDSMLLGKAVPLRSPLGNGQVAGQDSTSAVVYRDRIYWFWGDTTGVRYPLGHFWTAGATSAPPGAGLNPDLGIDLEYFVDNEGFSRPLARLGVESGPVWIDAVCVVPDANGEDRLVCHYAHMKDLGEVLDHGLAVYDDATQRFERFTPLELRALWRFPGQTHPIRHTEGTRDYLYLGEVFPTVRVPATLAGLAASEGWQVWTCLERGSDPATPRFTRNASGELEFGWRDDAPPADIAWQQRWIEEGKIRPAEACFVPRDVDSGNPVYLHRGSVAWNAFRKQWIMIAGQRGGTSALGEIWYAEAPAPTGPWRYAKKIVSHEQYSCYNPVHHPFLDQDGGRVIFFEGTYSASFSGNPAPTPRYDYNQIMYRLELDNPQLAPSQTER